MRKKVLSLLATLCILLGLMGGSAVSVSAASSVSEIEERLAQILATDKYAVGANGSRWGSKDCKNFVDAVSKELFGVSAPSGTDGLYYLTGVSSNPNWSEIGSCHGSTATESNITDILKKAQPGDVIQYCSTKTSPQHTAMIYSVTSDGFTIYDQTSKDGVRLVSYTWSEFAGNDRFLTSKSSHGLSLYRCNKDVSTAAISDTSTCSSTGSVTSGSTNAATSSVMSVVFSAPTNAAYAAKNQVTSSNVVVCKKVTSDRLNEVTSCGIFVYDSNGNTIGSYSESASFSGTSGHIWYDFQNRLGLTLSPGTTYYYQMYVDTGTTRSYSSKFSVTTASEATVTTTNTQIGVVSGTVGNLAINSRAASGYAIGCIPEGATCKVYPDRQSGNWYWVEYNGVSGYAYSKYIKLQ